MDATRKLVDRLGTKVAAEYLTEIAMMYPDIYDSVNPIESICTAMSSSIARGNIIGSSFHWKSSFLGVRYWASVAKRVDKSKLWIFSSS